MDSCLPDSNQKYMDVSELNRCKEGRLPGRCRCFIEYDDLYLPPSNDLHCYSPRDCCPCDLRVGDYDPIYGNIYLPPLRKCIPIFSKDPCGYPPPCNPCNPCCPPSCPSPRPGQSRGSKIQFSFPPHFKESTVCPEPSCSSYIEKLSDYSGRMSGVAAKPAGSSSYVEPRCATCDCHKRKCSPQPRSSFDNAHNPVFKILQSSSPKCKDCDCHKPKNCKFSTQICKFCQGSVLCFCEQYTKQQQQQLLSQGSPKSVQTPTLKHDKERTVTDSSMDLLQNAGLKPEVAYPLNYEQLMRTSRMELEVPCKEGFKPTSKTPARKPQSERTQLCCCGNWQCTQPRSRIRIECPFCKCVRSCCCGMCSCPVLTCPSKTPLAPDGPTARLAPMSSGVWTEPSNASQVPRYKQGSTSPEKCTCKSFSKAELSARVCYSSQQSRMKPSQEQSPTRRSRKPQVYHLCPFAV
uniref:Uncharacterized protein n=1 Tax=Physcomitrium patens TaxID=3218 RepID=A0A2K1KWT2_PHYPA|nr:hypothetical protein PHYPA_005252 [Physcomitrium patens]